MKSLTDILLIAFIVILGFSSCEDNELEIEGIAPSITAKFINNDSLEVLNGQIATLNSSIKVINDSIAKLEKLNEDGDETDYSPNFESLNEMKSELQAEKSPLVSIKATIESGKIHIQKIAGSGAATDLAFTAGDSSTSYSLPLNVNADISDLMIQIANVEYGISFSYTRDTLIQEGFIVIEASNVKLLEYSNLLDSVTFPCDTLNCKSHEANATIYF